MLLGRKLFRELWRAKGQTTAVLVVTALGVLLFVATAAAYEDLRDSYARTQRELGLADLHVDVTRVSPEDVQRAATLTGFRRSDARVVTELPVDIARNGMSHRVSLRVLSLPDNGQPVLDRVLILSGRLPEGANEVLVEKHLAQHYHLAVGDRVTVESGGIRRPLTVSGVGESAEYLWVARDENDIFPNPDTFGVGWMHRAGLRKVAQALLPGSPGLPGVAVAADDGAGNQLLIDPVSPTEEAAVVAAVKLLLGPDNVLKATPSTKLVGIRLLQMDVDGYKEMAAFFPFFFLGVGAFILASILARMVDAQRALVGTLAALGVGRGRILAHFLSFALILAGGGALLGAAASLPLGPAMTQAYAEELGIPFVTSRIHWNLVGYGLLAALAVAFLSGLVPALHASGLAPAEAMRPPRPRAGPLLRATRRINGPLPLRLAARDLLGRPLRSLGTALGVSAALVLVLATVGMLDSMVTTVNAVFNGARRYDLRVDLTSPEPLGAVQTRFHLSGVERVEGLTAVPASVSGSSSASFESVLLQGLPEGSSLLRSLDLDGRVVDPAAGGVVLTRALARSLGVVPGGDVRIRISPLHESLFRVTGFADAVLGRTATVRLADLQRSFGLGDEVTSAVLKVHKGDVGQVERAVSALPDAAHVENASAMRDQLDGLMGFGWVFLFLMLGCGIVLAAAILFNTATLDILERRRDFATLRALGRTLREISVALTIEHVVLALVGLGFGLPLAVFATKQILARYSSELFSLPFVFTARTILAACLGVVGVLLLAQWPALHQLGRTSLAEDVRVREG